MDPIPLFTPRLYLKVLVAVLAFALAALGAGYLISGELTQVDVVGSLFCAPIAAYLFHLWIVIYTAPQDRDRDRA